MARSASSRNFETTLWVAGLDSHSFDELECSGVLTANASTTQGPAFLLPHFKSYAGEPPLLASHAIPGRDKSGWRERGVIQSGEDGICAFGENTHTH